MCDDIIVKDAPSYMNAWCEKKYGLMTIEALDNGVIVNISRTGTA